MYYNADPEFYQVFYTIGYPEISVNFISNYWPQRDECTTSFELLVYEVEPYDEGITVTQASGAALLRIFNDGKPKLADYAVHLRFRFAVAGVSDFVEEYYIDHIFVKYSPIPCDENYVINTNEHELTYRKRLVTHVQATNATVFRFTEYEDYFFASELAGNCGQPRYSIKEEQNFLSVDQDRWLTLHS